MILCFYAVYPACPVGLLDRTGVQFTAVTAQRISPGFAPCSMPSALCWGLPRLPCRSFRSYRGAIRGSDSAAYFTGAVTSLPRGMHKYLLFHWGNEHQENVQSQGLTPYLLKSRVSPSCTRSALCPLRSALCVRH